MIWHGSLLCSEEAVLEDQLLVSGLLDLQGSFPWDPDKQIPEQAESSSPDFQALNFTITFPRFSHNFNLYYLMAITSKAALNLHNPRQFVHK